MSGVPIEDEVDPIRRRDPLCRLRCGLLVNREGSMYSENARRARSRVDQDWRRISSLLNVENQLLDKASQSQHSPGREELCTLP
jgi:hypothetical protein